MWSFAWQNLLSRPSRTVLAVVGLSIPIFGVIGLFSLSAGIRNLARDTLGQVEGLMVLRENVPVAILSDLPAELVHTIRQVPDVRVVAPEVWKIAPSIESRSLFARSAANLLSRTNEQRVQGLLSSTVIEGQDLVEHAKLKHRVFEDHLLPRDRGGGRFLMPADRGKRNIVISTKIAQENPAPDGRPRKVGDTLRIGDQLFTIVGLYETGSIVLDVTIVMDIATARDLLGIKEGTVSCFLVEPTNPAHLHSIQAAIQTLVPQVDARSTSEFNMNFGRIMGELDVFLFLIISLALVVGCMGIINTMLMSTSERFLEFGVMRANGWARREILALVTLESAHLGLLSGLLGGTMAVASALVANQFLGGGLSLAVTPRLLGLGLGLALVMGCLGGLYPAWRASRLKPMDAIRQGAQ
jgi:putative ABC transport system permease protein